MTFRPSSSSFSRWDGFGIGNSMRKVGTEHREAALGLFPSGFVLNHVPMLHEKSILDSKNVRGDPVGRPAKAGESAVDNDEVTIRHDHARLVRERWRQTPDEAEEA